MNLKGFDMLTRSLRASIVTVLALAPSICTAAPHEPTPAAKTRTATAQVHKGSPIAVVELFTSEACPSCPGADAFVKELIDQARQTGRRIYPLSFHVDYWSPADRKDPLSSEQFAQRQRSYVEHMGLDGAYTPQMIVNGTQEFIGSERSTGRQKIQAALASPASVDVKLAVRNDPALRSQYRVDYETAGVPGDAVINIALVERGLTNKSHSRSAPTRRYENVVRVFRTIRLTSGKQHIDLTAPAGIDAANCSVIAYVQNPRSRAVLGAAAADLQPPLARQAANTPRE